MPQKKKKRRKHTPITTPKQARFFGYEYGQRKAGDHGTSNIKTSDLKSHLEEWGRKKSKKAKKRSN